MEPIQRQMITLSVLFFTLIGNVFANVIRFPHGIVGKKPATDRVASVIYGSEGPISAMYSPGFISEVDAVTDATNSYNPISIGEDTEYMGAVLKRNDQYYYTAEQGIAGQALITVRFLIPKRFTIVAFWHTHGAAGWDRKYFSDVDTRLVKTWGRPFYLADYTGQLKVFSPGDMTIPAFSARRMGLPAKSGYAKGRAVRDNAGQSVKVSALN